MVLTPTECSEISKQNEIYRMASRILGYDMVVQDRTTRMPSKIHHSISNFVYSFLYIIFDIYYLMEI
jgi:hypothetical protein